MISTRLWVAATGKVSRDKGLADALLSQGRRAAKLLHPLLVLTDGWAASPGSIRRAFREKVKETRGVGRACGRVWPDLSRGTVITRTEKKRVVEITRTLAHGLREQAERVLQISKGGSVLTTACLERVNATFRERLASVTRTSRHAASRVQAWQTGMDLLGWTSHFCVAHHALRTATHWGMAWTPAMATGLTDHLWSLGELFGDTVAPSPWSEPKRRGRPPKQVVPHAPSPQRQNLRPGSRSLIRLRKGVFCSTTRE